jgi:hypothetical protein
MTCIYNTLKNILVDNICRLFEEVNININKIDLINCNNLKIKFSILLELLAVRYSNTEESVFLSFIINNQSNEMLSLLIDIVTFSKTD